MSATPITPTATSASPPDFADVYATHLTAVWRFVRSRVPDHHEASDVTSDVFVRAWRSWDRFDPARGPVDPWLFTIAHRAVTDWWRRRRDVPVEDAGFDAADDRSPEGEALRTELLTQLGAALAHLRPNQRDALALRFAGRLSIEHLAQVLGTTPGAAKMLIHRTVQQLRSQEFAALSTDGPVADLEVVIDDILARGDTGLAGDQLRSMLLAIVELHEPEVPEDLSSHVATCVQCAAEDGLQDAGTGHGEPERGRGRVASGLATIAAFMGVCLVCTVPALQTLTFALGVGFAGYVLHLVGVAAAPLVAWLVHRGVRRHRRDRAFRLARAGAIVMVGHAVLHVLFEVLHDTPVAAWVDTLGLLTFVGTDWIATGLLVAGAALNLVETQRWRRAEAAGLRSVMSSMPTAA